jgi:NADPH-dependent curcumin reductase CurA
MSVGKESYVPAFLIGQPITGSTVQKVIESQNDSYKVGDIIVSFGNWEKYTIVSEGTVLNKVENIGLPLSYYLGTLGPVGVTAYHGLLDLAEPKEGETVYVSGAAGAVGLLVGQIAKIKGCRV